MTMPSSVPLPRRFPALVIPSLLSLIGYFLLGAGPALAQRLPWPDKSGPTFDGHVAAEDAKGLPTEWDEASGRNIAWKMKLEGEGHSTPVIGEGRIWLTAATHD